MIRASAISRAAPPRAVRLLPLLLVVTAAGCAVSRRLHIYGQLDRSTWVVRSCDTGESYRMIGSSGDASDFIHLEHTLGLTDRSEPVVIDFDAETVAGNCPWEEETVRRVSPIRLQAGTCPPGSPLRPKATDVDAAPVPQTQ